MGGKSKVSDEFIHETYIKATRFNLTLTISTLGVILALHQLSQHPIDLTLANFLAGICFLGAIITSLLGQLIGVKHVIEKRPIDSIETKYILGGFWITYIPGVVVAISSIAGIY